MSTTTLAPTPTANPMTEEKTDKLSELSQRILVNALRPVLLQFSDQLVAKFKIDRQKTLDLWNEMSDLKIDFTVAPVPVKAAAGKRATKDKEEKTVSVDATEEEIMKMNLVELKKLATARGHSGLSKLNKAALQALLTGKEEAPAAKPAAAPAAKKEDSEEFKKLNALKVPELKERAKGLSITISGLKKADLIDAIIKAESGEEVKKPSKPIGKSTAATPTLVKSKHDNNLLVDRKQLLAYNSNKEIVGACDSTDKLVPISEEKLQECVGKKLKIAANVLKETEDQEEQGEDEDEDVEDEEDQEEEQDE